MLPNQMNFIGLTPQGQFNILTHKYVGLFEVRELLQHHPEGLTVKEISNLMESTHNQPFSHSKVQTRLRVLAELRMVKININNMSWKLV